MPSRPLPVIPEETYAKFNACIHCGLCLPACPTYVETGDEADSPRGRIHLMKAVVDGRIGPDSPSPDARLSDVVFEHLDRCLVCRACETACPSGVQYHDLIEAVRPQVAQRVLGKEKRTRSGLLQWMVGNVLPYAHRAQAAMTPLSLARKIGLGAVAEKAAKLLPGPMGAMAQMTAVEGLDLRNVELPAFTPAQGQHRGNVILLRGCVGSILSGPLNAACVQVITANGFDVHLLADEPCCGAMAMHANDPESARRFAREMVEALWRKGGDYFVSPIAGCGATLKELHHILESSPREEPLLDKAKQLVSRMRDVTEFLTQIGIRPPTGRLERTVTYHDPCHLLHAQRIADPPRQLLALIPGLAVVPLPESDLCCGAAGTYNLAQPEMAARLGHRKAQNILSTGATELVTANIGCALQIAKSLQRQHHPLPVRHVIELLAESYKV